MSCNSCPPPVVSTTSTFGCPSCTQPPYVSVGEPLDCRDADCIGNGNCNSTTSCGGGGGGGSSTSNGGGGSNTSSTTNSTTSNNPSTTSSSTTGQCPPTLSGVTPSWVELPNSNCPTRPVDVSANIVAKGVRSGSLLRDFDYNFYVNTPLATTWQISSDGGVSWQTIAGGTSSISGSTDLVASPTLFTDNYFFLLRATNVDGQATYAMQANPVSGTTVFNEVGAYENPTAGCTFNRFQLVLPANVSIVSRNLQATGDIVIVNISAGIIEIRGCAGRVTGTITINCGPNTATVNVPPINVNGNCDPCVNCPCTIVPTATFNWYPSSPSNPNEFLVMVVPNPIWLTGPITWSTTNGMQVIGQTNKWFVKVRVNPSSGQSCLGFSANGVCGPVSGQSCRTHSTTSTPPTTSSTTNPTTTTPTTSNSTSNTTTPPCVPNWQGGAPYCEVVVSSTTCTASWQTLSVHCNTENTSSSSQTSTPPCVVNFANITQNCV